MKILGAAMLTAISIALAGCRGSEEASAAKPRSVEATAAGATLHVSTPNSEIRAGEPLKIVIAVDRGPDQSVTLPSYAKKIGEFEVRASDPLPRDPALPDRVAEQLTLVTFESGELEVPPLEVSIRDAQGKETPLKSPALPIAVQSRLVGTFDPASFRDIKGAVDVPLEAQWPWIAGAFALAAIFAIGMWRWWFHRPAAPAVIESPHDRALRELDELAARQLPQRGMVLDFYVLLSDAVRHYVEGRFGIRAPEQTTKEFLAVARHHPHIGEDHQRLLASFLRAADLVKYAAQRPGPGECDRGLDAARGFVKESAPAPAITAGPSSSSGATAQEARS